MADGWGRLHLGTSGLHWAIAWRHRAVVPLVASIGFSMIGLAPVGAGAPLAGTGRRVVPFETSAADGTTLRGHVHLPARPGPLGTVLEMSPYWNTIRGPGPAQADMPAVRPFLDAGFAVALVNLRGTGTSDGCFQWGSRLDWSDTGAVIEALAGQPWSNGAVGMYGPSYEGWTQFMAMAGAPPALKAVVPISGIIDVWSLLTRRGAPTSLGGPFVSTELGLITSFVDPDPAALGHARCAEYGVHRREGLGLLGRADRTPYYDSRDLRPFLVGSAVAVLMSNGLRYLAEGHTLQFEGLWDELRPDRTHFVLGQWGHGGTRPDFTSMAVGWFDRYLRGGPPTTEAGVVEYQDDAGTWHETDRWPPRSRPATLHLSGERLVAGAAAVEPSRRRFESLDTDAGADIGRTLLDQAAGVAGPGPSCGPQQILYRSSPLAQEVRLAGKLSVDLTISSTLPGGNLVATLYRVTGTGDCSTLTSAVAVGRVQLDLRHWAEPGASQPFPVRTPTEVKASGPPLAAVVRRGERLVLAVGAGDPEILPDPLKPRVTLLTGPATTGAVTLPIVDGTLRFR